MNLDALKTLTRRCAGATDIVVLTEGGEVPVQHLEERKNYGTIGGVRRHISTTIILKLREIPKAEIPEPLDLGDDLGYNAEQQPPKTKAGREKK